MNKFIIVHVSVTHCAEGTQEFALEFDTLNFSRVLAGGSLRYCFIRPIEYALRQGEYQGAVWIENYPEYTVEWCCEIAH